LQCVAVCVWRFHSVWRLLVLISGATAVCVHVAVCCSVLQCVAVCCSVLQCVAVCGFFSVRGVFYFGYLVRQRRVCVLQCVAVCCSVFQCVVQYVAVCCIVLQCVAEYCCVLQCAAVHAVSFSFDILCNSCMYVCCTMYYSVLQCVGM